MHPITSVHGSQFGSQIEINHGAMLPDSFTRSCPEVWQCCGEGVFSWSVFRFYKARLLTLTGEFDPKAPFLLDLDYLRKLPGQQIVTTSIDEMIRLSDVDPVRLKDWSDILMRIIPDVSLGDRLLGCFIPGVRVTFYSATQMLGQIDDAAFVEAFSAIWLDERTRSPRLREALLGRKLTVPPGTQAAHSLASEKRV